MSYPVLHIHPTRMCNLLCQHCYSTSGPKQTGHLQPDLILQATQSLFQHGYRQASLSGGEPALYPHLCDLARGLKDQGFVVSIITNGWFPQKILPLCRDGTVDILSISFDGLPCQHDQIRQRKGAFEKARETLQAVVETGCRTGAVVAVTTQSLPQLPDLVPLLVLDGVDQIQFHPVAAIGRASEGDHNMELSDEALLRLLLLTQAFGEMYDISFSTDALTGRDIAAARIGQTGDLISPLVIEETGQVTPVAYGFNADYALGTLQEGFAAPFVTGSLSQVIARTQEKCANTLASAFFPDLVHHSLAQPQPAG